MNIQTLSVLENAIEPYRQAGYVVISQTDLSITLRAPARRFSWILFLLCLFIWPLAVIYLVWFSLYRGNRTACVRIKSDGKLVASGFTLSMIESERKNQFILNVILAGFAFLILIIILAVFLANQNR